MKQEYLYMQIIWNSIDHSHPEKDVTFLFSPSPPSPPHQDIKENVTFKSFKTNH